MRKSLILFLIIIICLPAVFARKPKDKAGKVTDNVFTDKKYNFELSLNDLWKYKISKNKSNFRILFIKKKYEIPIDYIDAPDYTMIPRINVYSDTTSLSVPAFIDSLLSDKFKSKQKKEILKEFEILSNRGGSGMKKEKILPRRRKTLELDGKKGQIWKGQVQYRNEVATSASSMGGKRVYGAYGGSIIGVKKGNQIVLFHVISEWIYFDNTMRDAMEIIYSLKFKE